MDRLHNKPRLIDRRKKLRRNLTPAEATIWNAIKNSKLAGRKFRRQHSVGPFILDFFCVEERLAVELDGEVHRNEAAEIYDHKRKLYLNNAGIKVIRFENFLVFEDIDYVTHRIQSFFGWCEASTTPSAEAAATPPVQEGSF